MDEEFLQEEESHCSGKRIYKSKREAVTVANRRYDQDHVQLRVYECELADHWHLTKQMRGMIKKHGKVGPELRRRPWEERGKRLSFDFEMG